MNKLEKKNYFQFLLAPIKPSTINPESITFDFSETQTCIQFDPVLNAKNYFLEVINSNTNEKLTKLVPTNLGCFDNLVPNTNYIVNIYGKNLNLNGEIASKSFFQPEVDNTTTINSITEKPLEAGTGLEEPVIDLSNVLSNERQQELVDSGKKFVTQFINWHKFTYSQWQNALNKYVPYLEGKMGQGSLKRADAVCPVVEAPSRCLDTQTITDHNGCSFSFCLNAELGKYCFCFDFFGKRTNF